MTQRFSEKINERNVVINGINSTIGIHGRYFIGAAIDKLSEYETAEEEGRMVVLPCSPKDTLYFLVDDCNYAYDCGQKRTCNKCEYRDLHVEEDTLSKTGIVLSLELFGKTVFLTREEAEKVLEEIKNKNNE